MKEFINLNHDEYGLDFIKRHQNNIIDNISKYRINPTDVFNYSRTMEKPKFRFRWNSCNPTGACLIFGSLNQDSDLTETIVKVLDESHILVAPLSKKNGMLADGYIFAESIEIDDSIADAISLPRGKKIISGIYTSSVPNDDFPFGYHIFTIEDVK